MRITIIMITMIIKRKRITMIIVRTMITMIIIMLIMVRIMIMVRLFSALAAAALRHNRSRTTL